MNKLVVVAFVFCLFIAVPVLADTRIEQAPDTCHVPYNNANVDDELKQGSCAGSIFVENGQATGSASFYLFDRHRNALPLAIAPTKSEPTKSTTTTGTVSGTNCTLVDDGGTVYVTSDWTANLTISISEDNTNFANIIGVIRCVIAAPL